MRSLLVIGLLVSTVGASQADTPFKEERLQAPGRVLGVHAEDLNGDKRADLLVVFAVGRAPVTQRRLAVWLDHGGAYSPTPDQVIDAPRGAAFVDVGDVDGDGKRAVLFGDGRGLSASRLDASGKLEPTPRPLVRVSGVLALPDENDLPFLDVMRDFAGAGHDQILLPLFEGTALYQRGSDGEWTRSALLQLGPLASYMVRAEEYEPRLRNFAARVTYVLPELTVGDYDGDGKLDLFAVVEDRLQVHRGLGNGLFSSVPAARHYLGVRTDAEVRRGAHVTTTVRDLDRDGVADLVVNKISGGLGQMRAQTGVYFGKNGGGYDPPAQVIQAEGYSGAVSLADLDGDGRPELVMPHVSVGLGEMARALLAKRMRVGWEARKNEGRKFADSPATTKEVDFVVDTSMLADVDGPYPSVDGDFDGDGKHDFVSTIGTDAIGVWLGGGKSLIANEPRATVKVTPSRYYQVVDLDGDKKSDLVLFYRGRDTLATSVVVLRNTGHGW